MNESELKLQELIEKFLSSHGPPSLADEIEGLILESFHDREEFDDLGESLALYSPGGGKQYVDTPELKARLKEALVMLERQGGATRK